MVARSPKKIKKAHELRKRVKMEKKRLRKRGPKEHEPKATIKSATRVHIKLTGEAKETMIKYCETYNIKPYKAAKQILRAMMGRDADLIKDRLAKDLENGLISEEKAKAILDGIQA